VNFSRQFNHNKANFLFVQKTLNLGAYLFVMKKIFSAYLFSIYNMFMSKQIRDPEVDPNEIQKKLMDWWTSI
jgi:hypothetical protein